MKEEGGQKKNFFFRLVIDPRQSREKVRSFLHKEFFPFIFFIFLHLKFFFFFFDRH